MIPAYAPSADEARAFERDGFLVTPPLFDATTLERVRGEVTRRWRARTADIARSSARGAASKADYSRVRPELQRLHIESPVLSAFCRHEQLARIARVLIGDDADLSWNQAYAKASGGDARTAIPWHQDAWYAEVEGATYNCWVAITRCTVENGTIVRAPKPEALHEHAWDEPTLFYRCEIDEATATPVELEPGQAFIFTGRVPHRSGVNVSADERMSYSISFAAPSARLRANGETFGDRVPVVRGGALVTDVMLAFARAPDDATHPGARVLAEILARAPSRTSYARATFDALVASAARNDAARADALLGELLAVLPESADVLGDLARARGRVDQILRELTVIRGTDATIERVLVVRALELDPENRTARAELRRLDACADDQRGTK